ncbi:type II toxin-antitoxin system PemK/MazF family toxin [Clostridium perfringens]|nr:type II toxin-antitoxin system PemK/MazF family toxin [Clostridium perfringens]
MKSKEVFEDNNKYKRGNIIIVDLGIGKGSEQGGERPCIIIQNNIGNRFAPTVIIAPITGQVNKAKLPTHVELDCSKYSLDRDSIVILEQIKTVSKKRCKHFLGRLDDEIMGKIDKAILISLGIAS